MTRVQILVLRCADSTNAPELFVPIYILYVNWMPALQEPCAFCREMLKMPFGKHIFGVQRTTEIWDQSDLFAETASLQAVLQLRMAPDGGFKLHAYTIYLTGKILPGDFEGQGEAPKYESQNLDV